MRRPERRRHRREGGRRPGRHGPLGRHGTTDRRNKIVTHLLLLLTIAVVAFPLYYAFVVSSTYHGRRDARPPKLLPGGEILNNYAEAWERTNMGRLLLNSTLVSLGITFGKIIISVLSAFAIVYFRFPFRQLSSG